MKSHRVFGCVLTIALLGVPLLMAARGTYAGVVLGDVTVSTDTVWDEDTYEIDNLTVTNGAVLTVAGGSTINVAGTTRITAAGTILLEGENVDGQVEGQWQGEGVTINTAELQVDAGSAVSADAQGYVGGTGPGAGESDATGAHDGAGGGYGGSGGLGGDDFLAGGAAYGDAFAPVDLGSGGGSTRAIGGRGGGAIILNVSGTLALDGVISANGGAGMDVPCSLAASGGGSGGSIYITTTILAGTGLIRANGGAGGIGGCFPTVGDDGGGGAGGRIAVYYDVADDFTGFTTSSATGAPGGGHHGAPGTMVFVDTTTDTLRVSENLDLAPDSSVRFGFVTVDDAATLTLGGGATLEVGNDLVVTGNAIVIVAGKNRSGQVDGEWKGAGATINARNVQVDAGSVISADAQGYASGQGPGAGVSDGNAHTGSGGGYGGVGGRGGDDFHPGGPAYGDAFAPADLGSGGGPTRAPGGSGGGAITLNVSGTLTLDGVITANGSEGADVPCGSSASGGGSGGSIYVTTATLTGAGLARANGGRGGSGGCFPTVGDDGGGGAGGRIAVYYDVADDFTGFTTSSVNGAPGGGHVGAAGSMIFVDADANALRVSENLAIAPDVTVSFAAVTVDDAAILTLGGGATLAVANDFVVTGNATVVVQSKNSAGQVEAEWHGAGATITARNVRVDAGSTITADAQGYVAAAGPGAGGSDSTNVHDGSGGGHGGIGGLGGDAFLAGGAAYGDAFAPIDLGSGGGSTLAAGGRGGGAVTLNVSGTLTLDGVISADGSEGTSVPCSAAAAGGGSGGSIFITTAMLAGTGLLHAQGGAGGHGGCTGPGDDGGGGAGGRIAVRYQVAAAFGGFTTSSVTGAPGGGHQGAPGTMVFVDTTTNALRVSENLDFAPDSAATFGFVTVDDEATLTLGGGATLTVENDLIITGAAAVIVQGKNSGGQVAGEWQGAGATINARNLRLDAGSTISADAQGYPGGVGPGAGGSDTTGAHDGAGGGYGGIGGLGGDAFLAGGAAYGEAFAPDDLGSGGGSTLGAGGRGGGAVTLNVSGTLTLDGVISADGSEGTSVPCSAAAAGGGSGGSIFITTAMLAGTGLLHAQGGAGGHGGCTGPGDDGGGGAGGRIAVLYAQDGGFEGFLASDVSGGIGAGRVAPPGTLVFLDTTTTALRISQHLDFAPDAVVRFGAMTLDDAATLDLGGGVQLTIDRDLDVTQGSTIFIEGKERGGQIDGQWRGAGATITARNVRIDADSTITADEQGYLAGLGPGTSAWDGANTAGGAGYGGVGGRGNGPNTGGPTYGSASAPLDLGSGGGPAQAVAGMGGGAIRLHTDGLLLDGVIGASGGDGTSVGCSGVAPGGGSGGSILIVTRTLAGDGSLHADGGAGGAGGCTGGGDDAGGGGGGRIAVHYNIDQGFAGVTTSSVDGGRGGADRSGAPGTLLFIGCAGDCNGDGRVTVDELVRMVNIALGRTDVLACLAGDSDHNDAIVVNEIVAAVNRALTSCG